MVAVSFFAHRSYFSLSLLIYFFLCIESNSSEDIQTNIFHLIKFSHRPWLKQSYQNDIYYQLMCLTIHRYYVAPMQRMNMEKLI